MIIYRLCKFLINLVMPVMTPLFDFADIAFLWDWVPEFLDSLKICFYLIPVYDLIPLLRLIVVLSIFRILVALVRFIFDAIPLY